MEIVDITNINRQLPALHSTVGKDKVEIVAERILDINPEINLVKINEFLSPERMDEILEEHQFDYVLDCIDSVSPKLALIKACRRKNKNKTGFIDGSWWKNRPSKVLVRDLSKTNNCYLAKQIRKRLKKKGITKGFRCVFLQKFKRRKSKTHRWKQF